jgi:hypothetical protein
MDNLKAENQKLLQLLSEAQDDLDAARGRLAAAQLEIAALKACREADIAWISGCRRGSLAADNVNSGVSQK